MAQYMPARLKGRIHQFRSVDRVLMRLYGKLAGGAVVSIKDGPLCGMKLAASRHTSHAHINGTYERPILEAIERAVRPGAVCYDLGASIGYMTLLMARKARHVYAFEPSPVASAEMRCHVSVNALQNVTLVPDPVSGEVKQVRFCVNDAAYGSSINDAETRWPVRHLTTTTLDLFAASHQPPDFIKIDVEGEEGAVLEGARKILSQYRPSICCEIHNLEAARAVWSILDEYGYEIRTIDDLPATLPDNIVAGDFHILARK